MSAKSKKKSLTKYQRSIKKLAKFVRKWTKSIKIIDSTRM